MSRIRTSLLLLSLYPLAAPAAAQKVHQIRLEVDRDKGTYRFTPARVTAAPGDILAFKVVNGAPHSVVFETSGLTPAAKNALMAAFGRKSGDPASPMLAKNGEEYRFVLPRLPEGNYKYFCLPHRAYDMTGEVVIK
jgi:plastocyanin